VQDRRGRLIALVGDDLVAGVIEIEPAQRDGRAGGNGGGRRVGDRSLAQPEAAGGQPAVVGEIDGGACLDVAQEDERKGVRRGAVVLNDGDVADSENGGHDGFFPVGSRRCSGRTRILLRGSPPVFSGHLSKHVPPRNGWRDLTRSIPQVYWIETPGRLVSVRFSWPKHWSRKSG
jgi:hypothetical protein